MFHSEKAPPDKARFGHICGKTRFKMNKRRKQAKMRLEEKMFFS
jgi:hypothetical protein